MVYPRYIFFFSETVEKEKSKLINDLDGCKEEIDKLQNELKDANREYEKFTNEVCTVFIVL